MYTRGTTDERTVVCGIKQLVPIWDGYQGPVVQSIVSLTSSLRGQLVKCFTTLYQNTQIYFVEKMKEAFSTKIMVYMYFRY